MSFWKLPFGNKGDFLCYSAQDTHTYFLLTKKAFGTKCCPLRSSPFRKNREVNTLHLLLATKVWEVGWLQCVSHLATWSSKIPPFSDSLHRDGLISKDEMMAYFLRAKSQLHCKMGPGFVHNFQEMTYLKPTFCEHCAGFVSLFSIVFSCV